MRDLIQNVGNVLTIQHQTCVDEIFKCTIFVGYGGVIFFYRCSTFWHYTHVPDSENDNEGVGYQTIVNEAKKNNKFEND